jgi:predicted permease
MSSFMRDFALGVRTLRKSPALVAVSITALTLGIGLTTMMFSIVYGAMLKGLPLEDGDKIVFVTRSNPERDIQRQDLPVQDYADFRAQQTSFSLFGGFTGGTMNVSGRERAERFSGTWVTADIFRMAGAQPLRGRLFREGEDTPGGAKVAVVSYSMWQGYFGGQEDLLGTSVRVNGDPYEIVGIMPEGFRFPNDGALWLPWQTDPLLGARGEGQFLATLGKLKPGVSLDQANTELSTMAGRLAEDYPDANRGFSAASMGFVDRQIGQEAKQLLWTMLGAVFLVLLIACSNVANLLLDRAAHRTKEVGVRAALGASRGQITRIFLAEAFVLAAAGTLLGMLVAQVSIDAFNRVIASTEPPFFIDIALHPPVLIFAAGVAVISTLLSGLIPAIQASRPDIAEVLKDESRGASSLRLGRMSKALVVFEISLSCGLLVAAGLMIKSVAKTRTMDTGFHMTDVFTARIGFPLAYTDTAAQLQFFQQLNERVATLPGVTAAAISSGLPGAQQGLGGTRFGLDGKTYDRELDHPTTRTLTVSPSFFGTLGIPLRTGRLFTDGDRLGTLPVAIVNERFVAQHLDGGDPLGRRVRFGTEEADATWMTVVGVVPDVFGGDPEDPRPAVVFRPFAQSQTPFAYVSARTAGDPMQLTAPVREAAATLNSDLPIYWPMTLQQAVAEPLWFVRVFGTLFMIFGFVALFLASIGLYAVMSFAVSRRQREMGIRMALGASAGDVVRLVFKQGVWQLGIGLTIGMLLAAGISRVMSVILFDVEPLDPGVFGGVIAALAITGAVACLIPARRATRADPAVAMRSE